MPNLVEDIARELAEELHIHWDADNSTQTSNGCEPEEDREYCRSLVRSILQGAMDRGWVLVPQTEPTIGMILADNPDSDRYRRTQSYMAMLRAAPHYNEIHSSPRKED